MGLQDRDYSRFETRAARPGMPPVTKWLLIVNIGLLILDLALRPSGLPPGYHAWGPINEWGCFAIKSAIYEGRIWEFVTFQFLHNSLGHVIFNSIGIFFFGPWAERWWGSRKFLSFYLLCGAAGAVFYTLLFYLGVLPKADVTSPMVGASAGLFGILFAVYKIAPQARVRLLIPPVEMSMKTMALILALLATGTIVGGLVFPDVFRNEGGEAGHLGGAIMGLVLMRFPGLLGNGSGGIARFSKPRKPRRRQEPKLRPRTTVDTVTSDEVDRILDKVSAEGFGSLTEAERKTLEKASRSRK